MPKPTAANSAPSIEFYLYPQHKMDVLLSGKGGTLPQEMFVEVEGQEAWLGNPTKPNFSIGPSEKMRKVKISVDGVFEYPFTSWWSNPGYGWNLNVDDPQGDGDFDDYFVDINLYFMGDRGEN